MSQDETKDQAAVGQPAKKPPAHEVIMLALREGVRRLAYFQSLPQDQGAAINRRNECDGVCAVIEALAAVLAQMEVPEPHRNSIAVEIRGMRVGITESFEKCREALKKAANAIIPGTVM